ncbi:MAG TPA: hypothetical protein VF614_16920 [Chthoniobacteraceae bacterium]|jgi:hypothetical protein
MAHFTHFTIGRTEYRRVIDRETDEMMERVQNPQDLLDGLLAVEVDEARLRVLWELERRAVANILKLL